MSRHLHIVCHEAPYPADCANSIDAFEKILALHRSGVRIHLHFFKCCDRAHAELSRYCETIHSYIELKPLSNIGKLIDKLNENNFPILWEDMYPEMIQWVTAVQRKIVVRSHSENFYPKRINLTEKNRLAKLFSWRAREKKITQFPAAYLYACISESEVVVLRQKYHLPNVEFLPPFVAWREISCGEGMGNFCLYHGNLSNPANERMAVWLLEKVFSEIRYPFVLAGKNPSRRLTKLAHLYSNTCIVANPSKREIDELVQKAHINIVPSFEPGKIYKLLHSLFEGRHCITNEMAVKNTNLEQACHIANDSRSKIATIRDLITQPFTVGEIELRKKLLLPRYDNLKNACLLLDWLY